MRSILQAEVAGAIKFDGRFSADADRIAQTLPPIAFRDLATLAWPKKTEFHLADKTGADPRTCRRWLTGENDAQGNALSVVLCEIMRRYHQRE